MKKSMYVFGIVATSLIAGTAFTSSTFATAESSEVAVAKPSVAEITAALDAIKALPGYSTYAPMSNADREQATPLFREYRYLAELVHSGETMIGNYALESDESLSLFLKAVNDAAKGCALIFANANSANNTTNSTETTAAAPSVTITSVKSVDATADTPAIEVADDTSDAAGTQSAGASTTISVTVAEHDMPIEEADETTEDSSSLPTALAHATTTASFTALGALATTSQKSLRKFRARR